MEAVAAEAVNPCIQCGDPRGQSRSRKNGSWYIIRIGGRCRSCYRKHRAASNPPKDKRETCRPKACVRAGQRKQARVSIRHFLKPTEPAKAYEKLGDHEKRVQSKRWVQEYRRATRWWNTTAKKTGKRVKAKATA